MVFTELRCFSGQPRLDELEGSRDSARRSIPQFRSGKLDAQKACVGIVRAAGHHTSSVFARPPYLVSAAHDASAAGDRQVGLVFASIKTRPTSGVALISSSLALWTVTKKISPASRSGLASTGRARSPPVNCVVRKSDRAPSDGCIPRRDPIS